MNSTTSRKSYTIETSATRSQIYKNLSLCHEWEKIILLES